MVLEMVRRQRERWFESGVTDRPEGIQDYISTKLSLKQVKAVIYLYLKNVKESSDDSVESCGYHTSRIVPLLYITDEVSQHLAPMMGIRTCVISL